MSPYSEEGESTQAHSRPLHQITTWLLLVIGGPSSPLTPHSRCLITDDGRSCLASAACLRRVEESIVGGRLSSTLHTARQLYHPTMLNTKAHGEQTHYTGCVCVYTHTHTDTGAYLWQTEERGAARIHHHGKSRQKGKGEGRAGEAPPPHHTPPPPPPPNA